MILFDSHCHVHFRRYRDDMDAVIRRAQAAGVLMLTVGTQIDTSKKGIEVAERYDGVWASVGLHPNHTTAQEFVDEEEEEGLRTVKTRAEIFDSEAYRSLVRHPKCVAVGECGLDFYRIPDTLDRDEVITTQTDMVRRQFALASEEGKPVVIHCREAHKEQANLIEEFVSRGKLTRRGVMHCFTGTTEEAARYLDLGFSISFSGVVTFPPKRSAPEETEKLLDTIRFVPLDRLLIETDSPYLAPVPWRGKRNEPSYVRHVAERIANIRGVSLESIAEATTANAKKMFLG